MTSVPPDDPLVALWQTAASSDSHDLTKEIKHMDRLHRLSNQTIVAILWCVSILLIFEETTARLASHGILSIVWISGLIMGLHWHNRAQCTRLDALTSDTVSLLKFMLKQAKGDLFLARCLYAGAPVGAVVAWFVMKFASSAAPAPAILKAPNLHLIQTGAGVAVLIMMVVTGVILSRFRVLQVKALTEKLKSLEDEM